MLSRIRRYFLTGLATILPLGLTLFFLWFIVASLGRILRPLILYTPVLEKLPPVVVTVLSFLLLLVIITLIGAITSGFIGRRILSGVDQFFQRLPLARSVYTSARQLTDAVFVKRSSLRRTVIVEYPRKGLFAVGFLTSETPVQLPDARRGYPVFFPTAPNPTSGWLAIVPDEDITQTSLNIEEGLKFVVSGGLVLTDLPAILTKD
ncbi:MAG: DUF502 domain-containing protein [candidate division WOR-3 bacterium]